MNGNESDENDSTDEQTSISIANTSTPGIIAEDGHTGGNVVISPGVWVITEEPTNPLFSVGEQAGEAFTRLAEAGQTDALASEVEELASEMEGSEGIKTVGTFGDGPITPDSSDEFTVDASEQGYLSMAAMLVPSNDMVIATRSPIPLRAQGERRRGSLTRFLATLDAGTEPNTAHGQGEDQAPAQSNPLQGEDENKPVLPVGFIKDGVISPEAVDVADLTFE